MQFLGRVTDIIVLSTLWLLGCLPVVTIVASSTALYYASMKEVLCEGHLVRNFFRAYRRDLLQSVLLELIVVVMAIALYFDVLLIFSSELGVGTLVKIALAIIGFECAAVLSYLPALQARFVLKIPGLVKNAFVINLVHLPTTAAVVFINAVPFILLLGVTAETFVLVPIVLMIGPGVTAWFNAKLLLNVFKKHSPPPNAAGMEQGN